MSEPWKRGRTSRNIAVDSYVDIDLDEFDTRDLLQELIERDVINEATAARLLAKAPENDPPERTPIAVNDREFAAALDEIRCGRRREALIHLERALGRDWLGQLS